MTFKNKMTSIALVSAMTIGAFALPTAASADVESSASISSMYLWRGQDVSAGAPALAGDITYKNKNGMYAFAWMSSEAASNVEVDLGLGYAGSVSSIDYDVSYYKFWYPEKDATTVGEKFADAGAEVVIGLTFKPVTFKAYIDAKDSNDYNYYTFSGSVGSVDLLYGISDSKTAGSDYTHFDVTYNANDKLSFTLSQASGDGLAIGAKDPLFKMTYKLPM